MLVTTTNTLQGVEIKRYLKPVSAHVVAGTGFLSDFGASFTDIFGGRSGTYQRQLQSLYDDATNKLIQSALQIGANCIIGLNIDMDEISGKGKAMFMITATGTAVVIDQSQPTIKKSIVNEAINTEYYDAAYSLIIELNKLQKDKDYCTPFDRLKFLLDSGVEETIDLLLHDLKVFAKKGIEVKDDLNNKAISFLQRIPVEVATEKLYTSLYNGENGVFINFVKSYIESANLINLDKVQEMIKSGNRPEMKAALKIATLKKDSFKKEDIATYQAIIDLIKQEFIEVGTKVTRKSGILSKEKEVWDCPCGKEANSGEYCSNCGNDIYGIQSFEMDQSQAISVLNDRVEVLSFIFK